jgi:hypothetical protein
VNVALGGVDPSTGGLVGARRGGASVDLAEDVCNADGCSTETRRDAVAFTGDIASLAGPDGSHFLGKDNPTIVIGLDTTGTHNIGRDIPLDPNSSSVEQQSGSTYHVGVGVGTLPPQPQTFNGEFKGYAAGMVQSAVPSSDFVNVVTSESSDDFGVTFNSTTNTLRQTSPSVTFKTEMAPPTRIILVSATIHSHPQTSRPISTICTTRQSRAEPPAPRLSITAAATRTITRVRPRIS